MDNAVELAFQHHRGLQEYLGPQSDKDLANASAQRASAREKLTRLTKQQFLELATDVYDEMNRRQFQANDVPFLPVENSYHPKRNQARQKLATLQVPRFKDLASDVFFEIERRYPEAVESPKQPSMDRRPSAHTNDRNNNININNNNNVNLSASGNNMYARKPSNAGPSASQYAYNNNSKSTPPAQSNHGVKKEDVPNLNFQSLDNLMADLGSMLAGSDKEQPRSANGVSSEEHEKMKSGYASQLENMQRRIHALEDEIHEKEGRLKKVKALEDELSAEKKKFKDLTEEHLKLKKNFEGLQDDYNSQQRIANDIRQEAANLLEETKSLTKKNEDLMAENSKQAQKMMQLTEELSRLKAQHDRASQSSQGLHPSPAPHSNASFSPRRSFKSDTAPRVEQQGPRTNPNIDFIRDNIPVDPHGVLDRSRVASYQAAVDDLLNAARSDASTDVLVAMKSIVIACKTITEETESYENNSDNLPYEVRDAINQIKNRLSASLANLMEAAKKHATSFGSIPIDNLVDAAAGLSETIIELLMLLKIKGSGGGPGASRYVGNNGVEQTSPSASPYSPNNNNNRNSMNGGDEQNFEIDELKGYLEKQTDMIVQAIQSLLQAMRQSQTFGDEFQETISGISSIVNNLVNVSQNTLSKPSALEFRDRGEKILNDLTNANSRLEELGVLIMDSPQSKSLKQKLASASYEIAKFVKELISLIE